MKRTGPSDQNVRKLIEDIRSMGYEHKNKFLLNLAERLEISRRRRPNVNVSKLERVCNENENIVVPGKLLSYGILKKPLVVYAMTYSKTAEDKITKAGGKLFTINELVKTNPKGSKTRMIV